MLCAKFNLIKTAENVQSFWVVLCVFQDIIYNINPVMNVQCPIVRFVKTIFGNVKNVMKISIIMKQKTAVCINTMLISALMAII